MKHPVLNNRIRLIVWWLVWLFLSAGQSLLFYYAYGSYLGTGILDSIISLLIYSGIGLSLWYPFSYFNSGNVKIATIASNLVASGVISIALWIILTRFLMQNLITDKAGYMDYWEATFPYRIGTGVFIYWLIVLSYYLFVSMTNLSEKNAREARLETLVRETELKMLRSQINPHFLFNSLNSISSLTITDPEKARLMVIKLSDFMRYALARKDEIPVSFRSELENIRLYLDIEKVRFGDKLETEENISGDSLDILIPVMLLQPLYENAVKHGVYESTDFVRITTNASITGNLLRIEIINNYDKDHLPAKGTGTGLSNVKRRLELIYGNKSSLTFDKHDGICIVIIVIPTSLMK